MILLPGSFERAVQSQASINIAGASQAEPHVQYVDIVNRVICDWRTRATIDLFPITSTANLKPIHCEFALPATYPSLPYWVHNPITSSLLPHLIFFLLRPPSKHSPSFTASSSCPPSSSNLALSSSVVNLAYHELVQHGIQQSHHESSGRASFTQSSFIDSRK